MSKSTCSIPACVGVAHTRGWCQKHYTRWKRHKDPQAARQIHGDDLQRLLSKVDKTDGCWFWRGSTGPTGYGEFRYEGQSRPAHVVSYILLVGPVPTGMELDHLCRVRSCIRPDHLEPVDHHANLLRGDTIAAQNAAKTHCPHGHEYTAANTYVSPKGSRHCRSCRARQRQEHFQRTGR